MPMRKIIKSSLISLAVLGMVGGSLNNTIANAKHRHIHYTRRTKHMRRHSKRNRLYRHHGRIRYSYRRNRHARRHYAKKYRRIHSRKLRYRATRHHHAKRSKANATHKYIVDVNAYNGQLGSDPRDAASATPGGGDNGVLVKLDKKVNVDGHTFYKVSSNDIDANGWIYAGDLVNTPNGKGHPFNWYKNEPKIEKWEDQQNGDSDVDNNTSNNSDNTDNDSSSAPSASSNLATNMNHNMSEIDSQSIKDINNDREANGLSPLTESQELDQIANMRAKQAQSGVTHIDPNTGNVYADEDGYKLGYNDSPSDDIYAENLATNYIGITIKTDYGSSYYNHNGRDVANQLEYGFMNHDGSGQGHKKNILSTNATQVGIGSNYNPSNQQITIAEDFE